MPDENFMLSENFLLSTKLFLHIYVFHDMWCHFYVEKIRFSGPRPVANGYVANHYHKTFSVTFNEKLFFKHVRVCRIKHDIVYI